MKRRSKFNATKVVLDGITFDSKAEASVYKTLLFRVMTGSIADLKTQVPFEIRVRGELVCRYVSDFTFTEKSTGKTVVMDVKSKMTARLPVYRLKRRLVKASLGIEIVEVIV